MITRYAANDAFGVFGPRFIAMDPGKDGGCVVVVDGVPVEALHTALEADTISDAMTRHQTDVLIVERQFVKMNASSALELAWQTGMVLGVVAEQLHSLNIVEVYPSTWQAVQRRMSGVSGRLNRQQGIELANICAKKAMAPIWEAQVSSAKKPVIEGISSAWGIAAWWLGAQVE
jgi:hypothetical protein